MPFPVLTDPVSTVSATYGMAFQEHLWNGWTTLHSLFVIDRDGVIRLSWTKSDAPVDLLEVVEDLKQKRALIESLGKRGAALRQASAVVLELAQGDFKAAIPVLVEALKDEDADIRAAAAAGLYWIAAHAESAVSSLVESLRDSDARVRRSSSQALAVVGPQAQVAISALTAALEDRNEGVRHSAADALKRIDPEAATQAGLQ